MTSDSESDRRQNIIKAAFSALMEKGYAGTSTLEIARRARVSKRELYAEFGSKIGILEALVAATTSKMRAPLDVAEVLDRPGFVAVLTAYGAAALAELTGPYVIVVNRLAVAEAERSAELGRMLDERGRQAGRDALVAFFARARETAVLTRGDPGDIASEFFSLLLGDLMMRLMLGVARQPTRTEIERRADRAKDAILQLYAG
jgi:AcrR family transcriptional regulator